MLGVSDLEYSPKPLQFFLLKTTRPQFVVWCIAVTVSSSAEIVGLLSVYLVK